MAIIGTDNAPSGSIAGGPSGKGHSSSGENGNGKGSGNGLAHGGRLGDLVHDYLHRSPFSRPETSQDDLQSTAPSKTLPSTGLKRNTQEWKEKHGDEEEDQQLPSSATGNGRGQGEGEGARGRGEGRHEDTIPLDRVEDQSEEKDGGWLNGYASKAFGLDEDVKDDGDRTGRQVSLHPLLHSVRLPPNLWYVSQ